MDQFAIVLNAIVDGIISFYNSSAMGVIKFLLGIYAAVLLADIILLLIQRGLSGDIRDTVLGMNIPSEMVSRKDKLRKKWDKVKEKLEIENESAWKVAIIEADNLIDDLIKRMGFRGENLSERLEGINPGQIENIEELRTAHEMRNRIIHDEDFKIDKKTAKQILGYYENFLTYFEVFS